MLLQKTFQPLRIDAQSKIVTLELPNVVSGNVKVAAWEARGAARRTASRAERVLIFLALLASTSPQCQYLLSTTTNP